MTNNSSSRHSAQHNSLNHHNRHRKNRRISARQNASHLQQAAACNARLASSDNHAGKDAPQDVSRLSCKNVQLQFYKQANGNHGSELAYDDRLINKISQQVGKSSKVTLERTL